MKCFKCSSDIADTSIFCTYCGSKVICSSCGKQISCSGLFCKTCGQATENKERWHKSELIDFKALYIRLENIDIIAEAVARCCVEEDFAGFLIGPGIAYSESYSGDTLEWQQRIDIAAQSLTPESAIQGMKELITIKLADILKGGEEERGACELAYYRAIGSFLRGTTDYAELLCMEAVVMEKNGEIQRRNEKFAMCCELADQALSIPVSHAYADLGHIRLLESYRYKIRKSRQFAASHLDV